MDIYFDENHDVALLNSDLRFTVEDEDVKQSLTIHLQFLFDEWFISTSIGIPYTQTIFDLAENNTELVYAIIRGEVKNVEGVETIDELLINLNRDDRELSISLTVNGTTEVEVII